MSDKLIEATILALQGKLNLNEAKPSFIKKTKNNNKDIHYEPMEGDYEHVPFDYVLHGGDYEGYIADKKGNKYTVVASRSEEDTGAIAGGTMNYYVTIAYGNHKITISSYTAIFSRNDGAGYKLFTDLEDGMYLEDYLQKNLGEIDDVSDIEDWIAQKEENGENIRSWEAGRLWVKENIIGDNEDYDERTSKQRQIDKRNEKTFVFLDEVYVYIDETGIRIAGDQEFKKCIYKGKGKYEQTGSYFNTNESEYIDIPNNTKLIIDNNLLNLIPQEIIPKKEYDFSFSLEDFKGVALELDLNIYAQLKGNSLKQIMNKDYNEIYICYYSNYNTDHQLKTCEKLDKLMEENGVTDRGRRLIRIYEEIQANMLQREKRGVKGSIVEIVYDYTKHEYRAKGNDGYHGDAWVQFPKDLRSSGKKYKVDELIWNGKNYRAKGNIEEIQ